MLDGITVFRQLSSIRGTSLSVLGRSYRSENYITEHTLGRIRGYTGTSLPVPSVAAGALAAHVTGPTDSSAKGGEPFANGITHSHTAVPVTLHPLDLLRSQQGVGHELVTLEDGVVESSDGDYLIDGNGCWLWQGPRMKVGYGLAGRHILAHRVYYERYVGPIPKGLQIDHLCRVRHCVNPKHLEAVTAAENKRRGYSIWAINARKTHCKRGHEFTPENTVRRPDNNTRQCRKCSVDRRREARRKAREVAGHNCFGRPHALYAGSVRR